MQMRTSQAKRGRVFLPAWVLASVAAAFALFAVGLQLEQSERVNRFRGKRYRMGVDHNPPNYDWAEGQGAFGYTVDVMNEASRRAGISLEWVYCPRGSRAALMDRSIDLWPEGYYRPGQYPTLHQTRPWSEEQHVFVWQRGWLPEDPQAWDGKRVSVTDRRSPRALVERLFPRLEIVPAPTRLDALRTMCAGDADIAFLDMRAAEAALLQRPEGCIGRALQLKTLTQLADPVSLFARAETGPVAEVLRDHIDGMIADGTVLASAEKWFAFSSLDVRQELLMKDRNRQLRWLGGICLAMALVIGILVCLIRKLRAARGIAERARALQSAGIRSAPTWPCRPHWCSATPGWPCPKRCC